MSGKAQKDFEELELYLQQAQDELLSSLTVDERSEVDRKSLSTHEGYIADFEGQKTINEGDQDTLSDILDSYDNVEFFKENKKKLCDVQKFDIKHDQVDDKNNNTINGNDSGEKQKRLSGTKLNEAKEIKKEKDTKRSKDSGQDRVPKKGKINSLSKRTSKKVESDSSRDYNKQQVADPKSKLKVPLTCKDVKNRSQGSQVVLKTGNRNHTDDLSDCSKSPNVSCSRSSISKNSRARPADRKSKLKPCQEASSHLQLPGNDHISGSLIKVTHENSSSFNEADMQIDGKQPSYLTGDNSQLDNGESDKEIEGGTLMSLHSRDVATLENDGCLNDQVVSFSGSISKNCKSDGIIKEKNKVKSRSRNFESDELFDKKSDNSLDLETKTTSKSDDFCSLVDKKPIKDDLEEFLEEINESIDELISERKSEMSESSVSVNSKSGVSESGVSRCDITDSAVYGTSRSIMSDSGLSLISRSDISESCISYTSTDSGYSTSNIGQGSPDQRNEDAVKDGGKKVESDVMKGNTDVVQNEESVKDITVDEGQEILDKMSKLKENEKIGEVLEQDKGGKGSEEVVETDEGFYWVTYSIEEGEGHINNESSIKASDQGNNHHASDKVEDGKIGNVHDKGNLENKVKHQKMKVTSNSKENIDSSSDKISANSDNKKDIKNLLQLPLGCKDLKLSSFSSGLNPHRKDQDVKEQDNLDNEDLIRNSTFKRKYSCPPTMFRIFKVVSVDIPKIDTGSRSGSNESIKRSSLKIRKKGHSIHLESEIDGIEPKRHSLEALLSKKKEEHKNKKHLKEKLDKNGFKMNIEPPVMFRDKKTEDINNGPILKPPPDFDTTGPVTIMDTQNLPPPVWDPGVSSTTSCLHSGDVTLELPLTPPPPSAGMTEKLISSTLHQYKQRKLSADASNGSMLLKPDESVRRKSADSGINSEYVDLDLYKKSSSANLDLIQEDKISKKDTVELKKEMCRQNCSPFKELETQDNVKSLNCSEYQEILPRNETENDVPDVELAKMLDLIESYQTSGENNIEKRSKSSVSQKKENLCHKQKVMKTEKASKSESLDRRKSENDKDKFLHHDEDDSSAIYATVDKYRPRKPTPEKIVPERSSQTPPPIPPKPKFLSEAFNGKKSETDLDSANSTDLQVMFNSLSPVLLRRNNSSRSHRKHGSSAESSPESTPDVSPRGVENPKNDFHKTQGDHTGSNGPASSLFMDPEMAKTWHGATSTDWSQYYGPQMRAMMKELNKLNNVEMTSSKNSVNKSAESLDESKCKTLPSKSLLDEMHKKFCADQYINEKDIEMTRALVLFRLKSQQPPAKTRRSQSFNIRMGMGASYNRLGLNGSSSSASTDSSPRFPRSSERLRIKTRPDVQYSPKPTRARGVTPEPLKIEDLNTQAQNTQKEEAEIEAIEACRWLRETGFPQYAQLYEDGQFPLDIDSVERDHDFLDKEDIQSLFRRLNTLNKCAIMKIGTPTKKEAEESDEEDLCALSDKWKYQRSSRRWSRKDLDCPVIENRNGQPVLKSASSHDSLLADQNSSSETGDSPVLDSKMLHTSEDMVFKTSTPAYDANGNTTGVSPRVIRRAASERMKGAKSFLKRMESLKGKRSRKNKTITEISGPVITDNADMQAKIKHLNCRDINLPVDANSNISETSEVFMNGDTKGNVAISSPELITSPRNEALTVVTPPRKSDSSSSLNSSALNTANSSALNTTNSSALNSTSGNSSSDKSSDLLHVSENGALSLDLSVRSRNSHCSDSNSSQETLFIPGEYRPGKFPTLLDDSLFNRDSNPRTRSYSYADDVSTQENSVRNRRGSHDPRKQMNRISIYDNVPIEEDLATAQEELDIILSELFQNINGLNKAINGENAEILEPPVSDSYLDDSSVSIDSQNPENEGNLDSPGDITPQDENEVISGTLSSPDISDHEIQTEDMSHDDSAEHIVVRERRDSGVGSSLTRTNSERRKYRIRWHSFQKSHRPTSESRNLQLCNLSAGQILMLRKLSLLKLTALIEKYAPNRSGWSLTVPRFMKRNKVPDYKDKNVFAVPFSVMIQRTGQALPQCILHAMRFLRRTAGDALGIFRKSGVRSRIQKLRNDIEANPEAVDFEDLQAYDVADLVKQYFRELPECLLTNKLSDIFISIFIYVPTEMRVEALQAAVVLMADENRDVLQSLLLFLSDIAKLANKHQMNASNLAVCFAPSLFNMGGARSINQTPSPRRNRKNPGIPDARELMEQKAAHECLTVMVNECKKLFTIPAVTLSKCRVLYEDPVTLEELNKQSEDGSQGYSAHIESCIQGLLKESREKFRGWVSVSAQSDVDVSYKKVGDGHPLRLWKCTVDVEAPPNEVLNRVLNERQKWDEDLLQWNTVEKLDQQTEVFQFVRNSMAPHPTRDYCVLRSWRTDLPKGACVLISTSIDHKDADLLGGIRAVELASRYLIEPCGTGKSRLTHISRVDLRGHSPEWYKKVYGHVCANFMDHIRASFHCNSEGPETKV